MRRKPQQGSGGYNNQNRKPRYQGSGGGDNRPQGGHHNNSNRPRRNYSAMREKYLAQARDALASGDRVLAENYFQHADHCYRMMVEEGYNTRNNYTPPPAQNGEAPQQGEENQQAAPAEEAPAENGAEHVQISNVLPAFLTAAYETTEQVQKAEPVIVQNWEE